MEIRIIIVLGAVSSLTCKVPEFLEQSLVPRKYYVIFVISLAFNWFLLQDYYFFLNWLCQYFAIPFGRNVHMFSVLLLSSQPVRLEMPGWRREGNFVYEYWFKLMIVASFCVHSFLLCCESPATLLRSWKGTREGSLPLSKEETKSILNPSESLLLHLVTKEFQLDGLQGLSQLKTSDTKTAWIEFIWYIYIHINETECMGQDLFHIRIMQPKSNGIFMWLFKTKQNKIIRQFYIILF